VAPSGGVEGYNSGDAATISLTTHRLDECMKFAYGERTNLGDPSFPPNIIAYAANMLSEETAKEIRAKINDMAAYSVAYYDPAGIESLEFVRVIKARCDKRIDDL
jgi:gamma-glutamyltranspeptidase / glutathione hydrolase